MTTPTIRYYAPSYHEHVHARILRLLEDVRGVHEISHEIRSLAQRPGHQPGTWIVEEQAQRDAYEQDFRPRAAVLKFRTGQSIRKLVRSRSGGYFLAGTVTILRNGQVEWLASHATPFSEDDQEPSVGFLKALLKSGPELIERLTPPVVRGAPELAIIDDFIASGALCGHYRREVRIGRGRFETANAPTDWRKSIDVVCQTPQETWILEGKTALNYEALGEVLTHGELYASEHRDKQIRLGIICGALDADIAAACKKLNITVFLVADGATTRMA